MFYAFSSPPLYTQRYATTIREHTANAADAGHGVCLRGRTGRRVGGGRGGGEGKGGKGKGGKGKGGEDGAG